MSEQNERLHQQAEALAKEMWVSVDWLEAAEKAALAQPGAVGIPLSLIGEATAMFRDKALAALQRVQAETREEDAAAYAALSQRYRYRLWCGHGCTAALYGDDGEMQCNDAALHGLLDFKRQPLEELEAALWQLTLKRARKDRP